MIADDAVVLDTTAPRVLIDSPEGGTATTEETISRPSRTIAAAVSSQEVSIPSTSIVSCQWSVVSGQLSVVSCKR